MKLCQSSYRGLLALALALLTSVSSAQGQTCSDTAQNALAGCATSAINSCASVSPSCQVVDVAHTLEDIKREASESCCGLASAKRRKACLARLELRYRTAGAKARALPVRSLILAGRTAVKALRTSDCGAGAYKDLF